MKKDNKKALYESIMTSVAKEVKKALNENLTDLTDEQRIQRENYIKNKFKKFLLGEKSDTNGITQDYVNVSGYAKCLDDHENYYELVDAIQWVLSNANIGFHLLNKFIQLFKKDFANSVSQHKPFGEIMYVSAIEKNIEEINKRLKEFKEITKNM